MENPTRKPQPMHENFLGDKGRPRPIHEGARMPSSAWSLWLKGRKLADEGILSFPGLLELALTASTWSRHQPATAPSPPKEARESAAANRSAELCFLRKNPRNYSGGPRAVPARSAFEAAGKRESLDRCSAFVAA